MDRVAVLGSTGQFGHDCVAVLQSSGTVEVLVLDHSQVECTNAASVRNVLVPLKPQVVINCAAFVRVDDCEDQAREAFEVNALGALHVAQACAESGAKCVYISTDYVFDGSKESPYVESDGTAPINVYGTSKLAGEQLVRQAAPDWLVMRIASLFGKVGARGKGGNFIETILAKAKRGESLRVVDDIRISPTYTRDAAQALYQLLKQGATGVIHAANLGSCTWYEFSRTALESCHLAASIQPVSSSQYPTRARRPKNSALASERLSCEFKISVPDWRAALHSYLIETKHLPG
jgi:dTDP-4-dehydrorhamnose reductase